MAADVHSTAHQQNLAWVLAWVPAIAGKDEVAIALSGLSWWHRVLGTVAAVAFYGAQPEPRWDPLAYKGWETHSVNCCRSGHSKRKAQNGNQLAYQGQCIRACRHRQGEDHHHHGSGIGSWAPSLPGHSAGHTSGRCSEDRGQKSCL
jgi:hypothetical protein